MLTRREAILISLAGYVCRWTSSNAASTTGFGGQRYAGAMVIDALGEPGGFDLSEPEDAPLSPKFIADALASGVTTVNVTVNEVGNGPDRFAKTIANMARAEHELTAHPDVFLKVLKPKDLTTAKETKRMGLIFGLQDTSMLEGDLKRLSMFYDLGIRIAQPTYNRRNLMGDGCLETSDGGLSRLGHESTSIPMAVVAVDTGSSTSRSVCRLTNHRPALQLTVAFFRVPRTGRLR